MLIIGDAALKELKNDHNVVDLEIIGEADQAFFIKNTLNAPINCKTLNRYTRSFDIKNDRRLLIYNSNELGIFEQMLDYTFSNKWKFIYAPAKILYMIELVKTKEMFYNVYYWEKAVKNFNYLLKLHLLPMQKHDDKLLRKLDLFSTKFYTFVSNSDLINNEFYNFRDFDIYKESDLYNIYASDTKKTFDIVSFSSDRCEIHKLSWKIFSLEQQIGAVLERAYTIAINEFIIPYYEENKKFPLNTRELFKKALMIIVGTTNCDWFAMFIIYHYSLILSKFNKDFINIFNNAIKYGDIEKIS